MMFAAIMSNWIIEKKFHWIWIMFRAVFSLYGRELCHQSKHQTMLDNQQTPWCGPFS